MNCINYFGVVENGFLQGFWCLVPNAICFQLFKFSGKSGGAFTFPSNSPDLPHMNERFGLFIFADVLAVVHTDA